MSGVIAAVNGSDWTYGASIFTFAFPEILFIAVASALYILYSKPHLVPGHRYQPQGRSMTSTGAVRAPGQQAQAQAPQAGPASAAPAADEQPSGPSEQDS